MIIMGMPKGNGKVLTGAVSVVTFLPTGQTLSIGPTSGQFFSLNIMVEPLNNFNIKTRVEPHALQSRVVLDLLECMIHLTKINSGHRGSLIPLQSISSLGRTEDFLAPI